MLKYHRWVKVKYLVYGHIASKWQSWDLKPDRLVLEPPSLTIQYSGVHRRYACKAASMLLNNKLTENNYNCNYKWTI